LESLRQLLGEGLHVHFQQNDTIRQIFDLPPSSVVAGEPVTKMTSLEKVFSSLLVFFLSFSSILRLLFFV